jgi:hypothetical protein
MDDLAPASAALQKAIAPAANDYTPPGSPEPETEIATSTATMKNPQTAKNTKQPKSKSNADKLTALPTAVKKSTEPR